MDGQTDNSSARAPIGMLYFKSSYEVFDFSSLQVLKFSVCAVWIMLLLKKHMHSII